MAKYGYESMETPEFAAVVAKATAREIAGVIEIDTRIWRDTLNGVGYYSMAVSVNGVWLFSQGLAQGDKDQARYDALQHLERLGVINTTRHYELREQNWLVVEPSATRNKRDMFTTSFNI